MITFNSLGVIFILAFLMLALLAFLFWIYTLISIIAEEKFKDSTTKILWFLVVLFFHLPGAIIYLLLGKPKT